MFRDDIFDQPRALHEFIDAHRKDWPRLSIVGPQHPLLTGMGASYHAAAITALHLHYHNTPASAVEATDLLNYGSLMLKKHTQLVFVSQSGASGEVLPILDAIPAQTALIGVTNHPESPLGKRAQPALLIHAGDESAVATKTYLNSLAALWLLARQWGSAWDDTEFDQLAAVADQVQAILDQFSADRWLNLFDSVKKLYFLGHGPHAYTARHGAMMVSEWAKQPIYHASTGSFRHGLIESAQSDMGVVLFASPGKTSASTLTLGRELAGYGVRVLVVSNGLTYSLDNAPTSTPTDEFLSPLLDVLPAQRFAESLATHLGIAPGFRYITKVVRAL